MRNRMRVLVQMVGDDTWYFGTVKDARRKIILIQNGRYMGMEAGPHQYFAWRRTP